MRFGLEWKDLAAELPRKVNRITDQLERGELFGMIKLGSRTELVLPREPGLEIAVRLGDSVRGGSSVLARYVADLQNEVS